MIQRHREMIILADMETDLNPVTDPEPEVVVGDSPLSHLDMIHRGADYPDDPFDDDEPLECGIENPEGCESCQ